MRAQEFESLKNSGEIEEARMGASDFDTAVTQGTAKGVLVGFEFEVLVPKQTVDQFKQSAVKSITAEQIAKIMYENDDFNQFGLDDLTPSRFDTLFKLKTDQAGNAAYPNAVTAFDAYKQHTLDKAKTIFNEIPEKVRAKFIPDLKNELARGYTRRMNIIDKQILFAYRLGSSLYYSSGKGKIEKLGIQLMSTAEPSWKKLFQFWLKMNDKVVAKNLNNIFDYDPSAVYKELDMGRDDDDEDEYREYDYKGAARVLEPSVAKFFNSEVHVFGSYHQSKKNLTDWYIEPDGSLKPTNFDDGAAEIVSPPLPAVQALDALKNFYAMSQQLKLYTNNSTGLHINVSIPEQIDVLKLALFLGDQYVLQQFGRQNSEYAKSSQRSIEQDAPGQISKKGEIKLKTLQKIAQSATGQHTASISRSGKYISFRHAGGNYLADYVKIVATVGRFIRAMLIAADPNAYANEYKTKLAKIIQEPNVSSQDYIMNIRTNGLPIYTISIWKLMGSVHVRTIVTSLQFPWQKSNLSMYSIQDVEMNSEQAKQNLLNNLRNPKLKDKATQTPVDKFILINLVPNSHEAIQDIMNTAERGVQIADNRSYNALGYALVRKTVLPPNHPTVQNTLKTILRNQLGKK